MCKITKKEYSHRSKALNMEAENLQELENIIKDTMPLFDKLIQLRDSNPDRAEQYQAIINGLDIFNNVYDLQHDVEQEQHFLDQEWNRRNWTGQERNEWGLVSNNID